MLASVLFTLCFLVCQFLLATVFHINIDKADFSSGQRSVVRMGYIEENRKMTPESSNNGTCVLGTAVPQHMPAHHSLGSA